jgi:hypothetical protein
MHSKCSGLLLLGALILTGCQENAAPNTDSSNSPSLAKAAPPTGTPTERAAAFAARLNAGFETAGRTIRLDEIWLFTVGQGTDPFRRLRTGARWVNPRSVSYAIDRKTQDVVKHTKGASFTDADVISAIETSLNRYNNVTNIVLSSTLDESYTGAGRNDDILDGTFGDHDNNPATPDVCLDIVDVASPAIQDYDPVSGNISFTPVADNLFGGWLPARYFQSCFGSNSIIGVTFSFSDVDGALNGEKDGYPDRLYTEQFYNTFFDWNITGAEFLDPTPEDEVFDIESIVTHEVGHSHGLGHFGGPNANQPFKLRPNGRVFSPEAVMNPFYLGGEKRELLPTDIAALRALYSSKRLH